MRGSGAVTRSIGAVGVVAALLISAGGAVGAPGVGDWAAKHPPSSAGDFTDVVAVPHSSDVWAISSRLGIGSTIVRRHHGKWQRIKPGDGVVSAIAAGSAKVVWAAGSNNSGGAWIGRWHGSTFTTMTLPASVSGGVSSFATIAASSPSNAWAIGPAGAVHWNGKAWSLMPLPEPAGSPWGLTTTSAKNAWAIDASWVLRWNGTSWKRSFTAPAAETMTSIAARSASDVVVVGYSINQNTNIAKSYIVRYNGKKWKRVKAPNPHGNSALRSVTFGGKTAWAAGTDIVRSTGGKWTVQPTGAISSCELHVDAAESSKLVYAVGETNSQRTCFAAFNGHTWKLEPSKI
jgi:hypothetical protein